MHTCLPQAYMKMMNDPTFLAKVGAKLGDLPLQAMAQAPPQQPGAAAAAAMAPPPPPPEINDLIDAAKYGDAEAVEDFIAVGKVRGGLRVRGPLSRRFTTAAGGAMRCVVCIHRAVAIL